MISTSTHQAQHERLIEQCKSGDNGAFRQLYELYAQAMFNTSLRILNDQREAEDVLQESFVSAFKKIGQFEGRASFGSWLKRIVVNKSIDALKRNKTEILSLDNGVVIEPSEEEEVEKEEDISYSIPLIQEAVAELPDGFRTILTLFLFEEYSHRMIAEELGITESTSKSQYFRARKKLASILRTKSTQHD